jgi:hypothetical protein
MLNSLGYSVQIGGGSPCIYTGEERFSVGYAKAS